MSVKRVLVLPHICINNANAWSSPYTAGFPSISSFGGATHALQRRLNENGLKALKITGFGVISHKFSLRSYQSNRYDEISIVVSLNPLKTNGERRSIVPEIKSRMEISILCELNNSSTYDNELITSTVNKILNENFRIASGDIISFKNPFITKISTEEHDKDFIRYIIRTLMPGYAITERRDLMIKGMEDTNDSLDALIDYLSVNAIPNQNTGEIERKRKVNGWIVPISTGYAAISDIGKAINQRDINTPHRFVEAIITLGEFKMVHRTKNIRELLWYESVEESSGMYCYQQNNFDNEYEKNAFDIMQI